ncbi:MULTISPECIES: LysR family transcriptional regulator [Paenibacillus]|uniref:LysR family transcriptional regulator n=1 Tax=Paenibacillus TaxID=44249 RepID=UPI000422917F|nr:MULTISPECIES: LysR family transcriptional regulator [Paenibacillus]KGP79378.1 LysR family transcriptional regulator [Paenibacillus sp. MAEPY1]KGP81110.1 LysR family transcriptional regulator [Paenibacillus sp. MAEPY2]OZQ58228.1 LysR family transcriptional regulator [Paenibacillus taichungensis]
MNLQQLKYVLEVASKGSMNEAAKSLFLSQPNLSNAIKELEKEIKITLFIRTNRGVTVTNEGAEFLGYARQVLQQFNMLEEKYISEKTTKQHFCVSTHHYTFAANAFVELVKEFGTSEYEFTLRETKTYEIIEDVKNLRSELGIIYLSNYNESVLLKLLRERNIIFSELFTAKPHVFISKRHPLSNKESIDLDELDDYPCLSFEQGEYNSFYFSEEILSTRSVKKIIKVSDRAAIVNFLIGLNGYTISSGVFPKYLHGNEVIAVPLNVDEIIRVGTIKHSDVTLTRLGEIYLDALKRYAQEL